VARTFSRCVPLGRLAEIDPDVRPYLCAILVAAMWKAKETLAVPAGLKIETLTDAEFQDRLLHLSASEYNTYGIL
jgi:hypothetical protein